MYRINAGILYVIFERNETMTFDEFMKQKQNGDKEQKPKVQNQNPDRNRMFIDKEFGKSSKDDYPMFTTQNPYGYRVHINNVFAHKKFKEWKKRVGIADIPSDKQRLEFEEEFIEKVRSGEYVVPDYRKDQKNKDDIER